MPLTMRNRSSEENAGHWHTGFLRADSTRFAGFRTEPFTPIEITGLFQILAYEDFEQIPLQFHFEDTPSANPEDHNRAFRLGVWPAGDCVRRS